MTEDDLKDFLEQNKADIQNHVRQKMMERLLADHQWAITAQIAKTVEEFVTAEIVPEVKKFLASNKGPILTAACAGAAEIGDTLSKAIIERTAKKLKADSYEFRNILDSLFK